MKTASLFGMLAVASAGLAFSSPALSQQRVASLPAPVIDAASVNKLTTSLQTAMAALPASATQADYEAALVFAIDQSGQPVPVTFAALNQVDASKLSPAGKAALAAVRATRARLAQRGTGAIAGGPEIGLAFGAALSINGGSQSGSSDYNP